MSVSLQSGLQGRFRYWAGVVLAFAIGTAGGIAADYFNVPLPFMLGALGATIFASLFRFPLSVPPTGFIDPMRAVLGVMIGSAITPELLDMMGQIGAGLALVPVYVVVTGLLGTLYFQRTEGMGRGEALFASLPGGLNTIVYFAEETGMNVRRIALAQSLRLALVVLIVPFAVRYLTDAADVIGTPGAMIADIAPGELALLLLSALVGLALARVLKVPGGVVIVPMLISGSLHLGGISTAAPPIEIVILAQIVLGTHIGSKFLGVSLTDIRASILVSLGHMVLMLGLTLATAWILLVTVDFDFVTGFLAFAPGGVAEMSLVALGLGLDVGIIATLHVARIMLIMIAAPLVYRVFREALAR